MMSSSRSVCRNSCHSFCIFIKKVSVCTELYKTLCQANYAGWPVLPPTWLQGRMFALPSGSWDLAVLLHMGMHKFVSLLRLCGSCGFQIRLNCTVWVNMKCVLQIVVFSFWVSYDTDEVSGSRLWSHHTWYDLKAGHVEAVWMHMQFGSWIT